MPTPKPLRTGYAIVRPTFFQGFMPACYDETNYPVVFSTELEAQREIADNQFTRIQELAPNQCGLVVNPSVCPELVIGCFSSAPIRIIRGNYFLQPIQCSGDQILGYELNRRNETVLFLRPMKKIHAKLFGACCKKSAGATIFP